MRDVECVEFLQWCLPVMSLRWKGFRKVRNQVCKRISRRMNELKLSGPSSYKRYVEGHPEEWSVLDSMCRITISRFWRDRGVIEEIRTNILPALARKAHADREREVRCWSVGCAAGEEPYTLQIMWESLDNPPLPLRITATDADKKMIERAGQGAYKFSSLKDLPEKLSRRHFKKSGDLYIIDKDLTRNVEFTVLDIRKEMPHERFHLILCRNLVFTYFNESLQRESAEKILERLLPGGFLVIGINESIPEGTGGIVNYKKKSCIYRKVAA